jgi:hypothetical protein
MFSKTSGLLYLCLFLALPMRAQELHHQMLSAQGGSFELQNGYHVSQTIGQQSSIGNGDNQKFSIIQGFQQSKWATLITNNPVSELQSITVFPNPFLETVNFEWSAAIQGEVTIQLYNVSGQLVLTRKVIPSNNRIQLQLALLSRGVYLVQIRSKRGAYYTKIIKK